MFSSSSCSTYRRNRSRSLSLSQVGSTKGQSIVELVVGLIVIIPIILFCVDAAMLYMAVNLNDNVCRDAARAASAGPPDAITSGEPKRRADAIVKKVNKFSGSIVLDPNVVVAESLTGTLPKAPFGGPVKGDVTVTTAVTVYPPFVLAIFTSTGFKFTAQKTLAYTWAMPSTAKQDPTSGTPSQTF